MQSASCAAVSGDCRDAAVAPQKEEGERKRQGGERDGRREGGREKEKREGQRERKSSVSPSLREKAGEGDGSSLRYPLKLLACQHNGLRCVCVCVYYAFSIYDIIHTHTHTHTHSGHTSTMERIAMATATNTGKTICSFGRENTVLIAGMTICEPSKVCVKILVVVVANAPQSARSTCNCSCNGSFDTLSVANALRVREYVSNG